MLVSWLVLSSFGSEGRHGCIVSAMGGGILCVQESGGAACVTDAAGQKAANSVVHTLSACFLTFVGCIHTHVYMSSLYQ